MGSRKAVRCGLGFDLDLPAPLNNAYHGKVIYQGVSVLWGRKHGEYFDVARVKTVWANMSYDNHKTIDKSKYVQEIA